VGHLKFFDRMYQAGRCPVGIYPSWMWHYFGASA